MKSHTAYCEPFSIRKGKQFEIHKVAYREDEPYSCHPHFHEVHEFILFEKIEGNYSHSFGKHKINNRDLVFTAANQVHNYDIESGAKAWTIIQFIPEILHDVSLKSYLPLFQHSNHFTFSDIRRNFIQSLVDELFYAYNNNAMSGHAVGVLKTLISTVAEYGYTSSVEELSNASNNKTFQKFSPIIHLLQEHKERDLSLEDAAKICFMSPSHFSRSFKTVYQVSFSEYKLRTKMFLAARLLLTTDQSITNLGYELNFASPSHFIASFKKQFGETPKQYQKRHLE